MERHPITQPNTTDVLVVGAGLAGLATATRLLEMSPDCRVTVVDRPAPQSNTQIAGQRYRAGIAGQRQDARGEVTTLLANRNDGIVTPQMETFASIAEEELRIWSAKPGLEVRDSPEWFGPQFGTPNSAGKGHGKSVLKFAQDQARSAGVNMMHGTVIELDIQDGTAAGVWMIDAKGEPRFVRGTFLVLAGGTACGQVLLSTNKPIEHSATELAVAAGLPLQDLSLHMVHPFGNSGADGSRRIGCHETDNLAGAQVYLPDGNGKLDLDRETTELLGDHQAHYYFPQIARRFNERGGVATIQHPNGTVSHAGVSEHYWHAGITTTNGVRVTGHNNVYAVGDASNVGYWTNHKERFPGVALTKCLVDGVLTAEDIVFQSMAGTNGAATLGPQSAKPTVHESDRTAITSLRQLNSHYLTQLQQGRDPRVAGDWYDALDRCAGVSPTLLGLSKRLALAHAIDTSLTISTNPSELDDRAGAA